MAHSVWSGGCCRFRFFYPPEQAEDFLPACRKEPLAAVRARAWDSPVPGSPKPLEPQAARSGAAYPGGWRRSRSRGIRLGWPAAYGGMACPRRAGNIPQITHPCGGPAGPVLYRPAGNGARIPYGNTGRSGSRILRRCGRNL